MTLEIVAFDNIFGTSRDNTETLETDRLEQLKKTSFVDGYPIPVEELDETTIGALFKLVKEMPCSESRYYQLRQSALTYCLFFERSRDEMRADLHIMHTKMGMNKGETAIDPQHATSDKLLHHFMDVTGGEWPANGHDALLAARVWRREFMIDAYTDCIFEKVYNGRIFDLLTSEQNKSVRKMYPGMASYQLSSDLRPSIVRPIIEKWVDSGDLEAFPSDELYQLIIETKAAW